MNKEDIKRVSKKTKATAKAITIGKSFLPICILFLGLLAIIKNRYYLGSDNFSIHIE